MKKILMKRLESAILCIMMVFSTISPNVVMAADMPKTETTTKTAKEGKKVSVHGRKTTFPVHAIHKTGSDKENFVIVIMGDGYTKDQQDDFLETAKSRAKNMLRWSPYKEYSDRINIYAVQVVSNQDGMSEYGGNSKDTYFHVKGTGKAAIFSGDGADKARALRTELEMKYLDEGATVGTIHILSNSTSDCAASMNSLFSFSTKGSNIDATTHEIAHSIGRLGDEYERYTDYPNTSATADSNTIKWRKLLGFRGVGVTQAGTDTAFAPSRKCMMRWLGQDFCEVCKIELATKLSDAEQVSNPEPLYVANPEITIPHSSTGTLDTDSENYRITEKNIIKANGKDLEFRTVVQNMINKEQSLEISLCIKDKDGKEKYGKTQKYSIPALSNSYAPDEARESLSVVITDVKNLEKGDKLEGKVIDTSTNEVLATDKTASQEWSTVNLQYQLKDENGKEVPGTTTSIVHVPKGSTYTLRKPDLTGYSYVESDVNGNKVEVTKDSFDITYYYTKNSSPVDNENLKPVECKSSPVHVTYDGQSHSFDIQAGEGVHFLYSDTKEGPYIKKELSNYKNAGNYTVYFEAFSDSARTVYGEAYLEIEKVVTGLKLISETSKLNGGGTITLKLEKENISEKDSVRVSCDDSEISLVQGENDTWTATLPDKTKTYTFTAHHIRYDETNYTQSEDSSCQVSVTGTSKPNGNAGSSGGSSGGGAAGGGSGGGVAGETPEKPPAEKPETKPEETPGSKPETPKPEIPDVKPSQKPSNSKENGEVVVSVKPTTTKNNTKIENIYNVVKDALEKVQQEDKKAKNIIVTIKSDGKTSKKVNLRLDQLTLNLLVNKEVKGLQLDSGNVKLILNQESLKEVKRQIPTDAYLKADRIGKNILSSKAKKIVGNRPIYDLAIIGANKKQLTNLKKGKITVEIPYTPSKKEKKKKLFVYSVKKKGNVTELSKATYNAKTKTIKVTTNKLAKIAVGYKR